MLAMARGWISCTILSVGEAIRPYTSHRPSHQLHEFSWISILYCTILYSTTTLLFSCTKRKRKKGTGIFAFKTERIGQKRKVIDTLPPSASPHLSHQHTVTMLHLHVGRLTWTMHAYRTRLSRLSCCNPLLSIDFC